MYALKAAKYLSQLVSCIEHHERLGEQILTMVGADLPAGVVDARVRQRAIFDQLVIGKCAGALRELVDRLSVVPEPGALILASQLDDLATKLDAHE